MVNKFIDEFLSRTKNYFNRNFGYGEQDIELRQRFEKNYEGLFDMALTLSLFALGIIITLKISNAGEYIIFLFSFTLFFELVDVIYSRKTTKLIRQSKGR